MLSPRGRMRSVLAGETAEVFGFLGAFGFVLLMGRFNLLYVSNVHFAVVFLRLRLTVLLVHLFKLFFFLFVKTFSGLSILLLV